MALKSLPLPNDKNSYHLLHADNPDFIILAGAEVFGLEVTEAISQALARALAKSYELNVDRDLSEFARDDGKFANLPKHDFERVLKTSDDKESLTWFGNEPEELLARLVLEAVEKKRSKISSYYSLVREEKLFIVVYDRSFAPAIDYNVFLKNIDKQSFCGDSDYKIFRLSASGKKVYSLGNYGSA